MNERNGWPAHGLAVAFFAIIVWSVYSGTTSNTFHFDDYDSIVENQAIHLEALTLQEIVASAAGGFLPRRIIPNLSFAIDWYRGGGDAKAFIQTNIFIHFVNCVLLYSFLVRLFSIAAGTSREYPAGAIFLAVAIWAVHPLNVQPVMLVVQRMTLLAMTFSIAALYQYLRLRTANSSRGKLSHAFLMAAFMGCAFVSKENTWLLPLWFLIIELGLFSRPRQLMAKLTGAPRMLRVVLLAVLVLATVTLLAYLNTSILPGYRTRDFTLVERLLTQPAVVVFHLSQFIWPAAARFGIFHDIQLVNSYLPLIMAVAYVMIGMLLIGSDRWRLAAMFMLLLPAMLLVESSVVPLEMIYEHRMYLPLIAVVGLLVWLGSLGGRKSAKPGRIAVLSVIIVPLLVMQSRNVSGYWRDNESLYRQAVTTAPNAFRAHFNYANALRSKGQPSAAERHYLEAMQLNPGASEIYNNLAGSLRNQGENAEAYSYYLKAIEIEPRHLNSQINLAILDAEFGRTEQALKRFDKIIALAPDYEPAYYEKGRYLAWLGRHAEAYETYQNGLRNIPGGQLLNRAVNAR